VSPPKIGSAADRKLHEAAIIDLWKKNASIDMLIKKFSKRFGEQAESNLLLKLWTKFSKGGDTLKKGGRMPKVGSKHYSYTAKGMAAAKAAAKKKGTKVQYKNKGGMSKKK